MKETNKSLRIPIRLIPIIATVSGKNKVKLLIVHCLNKVKYLTVKRFYRISTEINYQLNRLTLAAVRI